MTGPGDDHAPDGAPVPALRASDADRERTSELLRRHTAEGRLDPDELDERLTGTYAARTVGELDALTADLPVLADPSAPALPVDHEARAELRAHLLQRGGGAAAISLVCVIVWLAAGASGSFWPIWVVLGTGAGVGATWWRGLGPGGDPVRELERAEHRRERHDDHRGHRRHGGRDRR